MNWKRAIGIGCLLYVLSFIVGIIVAVLSGINMETAESVPQSVWVIGMIITVVLVVGATLWYFNKEKATLRSTAQKENMSPGGFEPPSTGPKPVVLSKLYYGPRIIILNYVLLLMFLFFPR
jgi:hypothetical protein